MGRCSLVKGGGSEWGGRVRVEGWVGESGGVGGWVRVEGRVGGG